MTALTTNFTEPCGTVDVTSPCTVRVQLLGFPRIFPGLLETIFTSFATNCASIPLSALSRAFDLPSEHYNPNARLHLALSRASIPSFEAPPVDCRKSVFEYMHRWKALTAVLAIARVEAVEDVEAIAQRVQKDFPGALWKCAVTNPMIQGAGAAVSAGKYNKNFVWLTVSNENASFGSSLVDTVDETTGADRQQLVADFAQRTLYSLSEEVVRMYLGLSHALTTLSAANDAHQFARPSIDKQDEDSATAQRLMPQRAVKARLDLLLAIGAYEQAHVVIRERVAITTNPHITMPGVPSALIYDPLWYAGYVDAFAALRALEMQDTKDLVELFQNSPADVDQTVLSRVQRINQLWRRAAPIRESLGVPRSTSGELDSRFDSAIEMLERCLAQNEALHMHSPMGESPPASSFYEEVSALELILNVQVDELAELLEQSLCLVQKFGASSSCRTNNILLLEVEAYLKIARTTKVRSRVSSCVMLAGRLLRKLRSSDSFAVEKCLPGILQGIGWRRKALLRQLAVAGKETQRGEFWDAFNELSKSLQWSGVVIERSGDGGISITHTEEFKPVGVLLSLFHELRHTVEGLFKHDGDNGVKFILFLYMVCNFHALMDTAEQFRAWNEIKEASQTIPLGMSMLRDNCYLPLLTKVVLQPPPAHLAPATVQISGARFIHQSSTTKRRLYANGDFMDAGEVVYGGGTQIAAHVSLFNPLSFPLMFESLRLVVDGVQHMSYVNRGDIVGANSSAELECFFTPQEAGVLRVSSVEVVMYEVPVTLGLTAAHPSIECLCHPTAIVIPPMPQIQLACLMQSNSAGRLLSVASVRGDASDEAANIAHRRDHAADALRLFHNEVQTVRLQLRNLSEVAVEELRVSLHNPNCGLASCRNCAWGNTTVDGDLAQYLPLHGGNSAACTIEVAPPKDIPSRVHATEDKHLLFIEVRCDYGLKYTVPETDGFGVVPTYTPVPQRRSVKDLPIQYMQGLSVEATELSSTRRNLIVTVANNSKTQFFSMIDGNAMHVDVAPLKTVMVKYPMHLLARSLDRHPRLPHALTVDWYCTFEGKKKQGTMVASIPDGSQDEVLRTLDDYSALADQLLPGPVANDLRGSTCRDMTSVEGRVPPGKSPISCLETADTISTVPLEWLEVEMLHHDPTTILMAAPCVFRISLIIDRPVTREDSSQLALPSMVHGTQELSNSCLSSFAFERSVSKSAPSFKLALDYRLEPHSESVLVAGPTQGNTLLHGKEHRATVSEALIAGVGLSDDDDRVKWRYYIPLDVRCFTAGESMLRLRLTDTAGRYSTSSFRLTTTY